MKDYINKNKLNNKQLMGEAIDGWYADAEKEGLLLVREGWRENDTPQTIRSMQISHNANHILWFFTLIMDSVLSDREQKNAAIKIKRVLCHIICLREFIEQDQQRVLSQAIDDLAMALYRAKFDCNQDWALFYLRNWETLRNLASYFGKEEFCFPASSRKQLEERVFKNDRASNDVREAA